MRVATEIYRWLKEKNELIHITTADTSCRAADVSDFVLELLMLEIKVIRRRRRRGWIRKPTNDKKKSTADAVSAHFGFSLCFVFIQSMNINIFCQHNGIRFAIADISPILFIIAWNFIKFIFNVVKVTLADRIAANRLIS